jgi:hypothetical protein
MCALVWLLRGIYVYWDDPRIINFLAAWIPAAGSTLLAFVPDREMTTGKKWAWRCSVMAVGFGWSAVLWHQQVIADKAASDSQKKIVTEAVTQSNQHSDQKIDQKIGEVHKDVQDVKKDLEAKIGETSSASTSSLSERIDKVGKPMPPELAHLQFSLWKDGMKLEDFPILTTSIRPDKDGTFPVGVTFQNTASTSAEALQVNLAICGSCSFASEPSGFQKFSGMGDFERGRTIGDINGGVTFEEIKFSIKAPEGVPSFEIGLQYSCKTCGKATGEWQKVTIFTLPPLTQPQ